MLGLADHDRVPLPDVDPGGIVLLHGVGQVRGLELVDACPQGGKVEAVDIIEVDVQRKRVTARMLCDRSASFSNSLSLRGSGKKAPSV